MRQFVLDLQEFQYTRGIFIYPNTITGPAQKVVDSLSSKITIELFHEEELLVNITHHELVPRHEVLSSEEKKELLDRYKVKEAQLPRIHGSDPVAKYLGLRRGQVVKIIRKSETSGRYASYRLCTGK